MPIRPITLIYGANSSGKSSILHSILLANHALTAGGTSPLDVHSPRLSDSVDLGGFSQYIHKHDTNLHFSFGVDIDLSDLLPPTLNFFDPAEQVSLFYNIAGPGTPHVISFMLSLDNDLLLTSQPSGIILNPDHPFCLTLAGRVLEEADLPSEPTPRDIKKIRSLIQQHIQPYFLKFNSLRPYTASTPQGHSDRASARAGLLTAVASGDRDRILSAAVASYLPTFLTDLIEHIVVIMEDTFGEVSYLGPLRTYPTRRSFTQSMAGSAQSASVDTWGRLASEHAIRSKVNNWLSAAHHLQTPYELVVREWLDPKSAFNELKLLWQEMLKDYEQLIAARESSDRISFVELWRVDHIQQLEASEMLVDELEQQIADMEDEVFHGEDPQVSPDDEAHLDSLKKELDAARVELEMSQLTLEKYDATPELDIIADILENSDIERRYDLQLMDRRRNIEVSARDIGVGISQVLPVLVAAFAATERIIAIEQPELHLHPALQAELADVFITSALGPFPPPHDTGDMVPTNFILETHSEHLILRIMRRMRETVNGTLPEGIPPVTPNDVAILFVQPKEGSTGSAVRHLELSEDGELLDPWPGGFFEEGFRERFS